jgi:putative SOS response-associated peptidase YedK
LRSSAAELGLLAPSRREQSELHPNGRRHIKNDGKLLSCGMRPDETEIQMVQRHVREGAAILARHLALIRRLSDLDLPTDKAEELLVLLERVQYEHVAHLNRLAFQPISLGRNGGRMCNDYRLMVDVATIVEDFSELKIKIRFGEGTPNIQPREDIKITDTAPIIMTIEGASDEGDLVQRRWSWPGANKRPVYNFKSEGREFASNRCLIVADGFYEFTDPKDPTKKRKDKWLFTKRDEPIFCIAGIWRDTKEVGQAFTMLTMAPGPDIAPYHDRQIAILDRSAWSGWLNPKISAQTLIKPLPGGTLAVQQVA